MRTRVEAAQEWNAQTLEGVYLSRAFNELASYAKQFKPDWIIGVHPGGRILSVLLTERLGLPRQRCLYAGTYPARNPCIAFYPDPDQFATPVSGRVLLVDDIVRSGKTLNDLKTHLKGLNFEDDFQVTNVRFAALLLVATDIDKNQIRFLPDWFSLRTNQPGLMLPWSGFGERVATQYRLRQANAVHDEGMITAYEELTQSYDKALSFAKECFLAEPKTNQRASAIHAAILRSGASVAGSGPSQGIVW